MAPWDSVVSHSDPPSQWNPLQWDAISQFYPWRVFYARSMGEGTIPLWNPHQFCGTPFLADGQSAVLYPPNLIFLVFDPITAFTVFAALHLFLAAAFMYLLLGELDLSTVGRVVGAISYAFCAFMVLWLELPTFVSVAVYLPLILFLIHRAVERRSVFYGMLAGAVQALTFLAGHFQIAFYVGFAVLLWWVWKLVAVRREEGRAYAFLKVVLPFVACFVIGALVAAPQVLPTQELAANSHRVRAASAAGYEGFLDNALKPHRFVTAFVPDFFGSPSEGDYFLGSAADYTEYGLYIGILPLMLAFLAVCRIRKQRHVGFFALLALIAILVALGTPINALFYYLIPGFSALGGPNRILLLYFFAIAALAGFGADHFAGHASDETRWRNRTVGAGTLPTIWALVVLVGLFFAFNALAVDFVEGVLDQPFAGALAPAGMSFVALLLASMLLLLARAGSQVSRATFSVAAVLVVVADLFAFGINYNPTCGRDKIYPDTPLTTRLQSVAKNARIAPINPHWSLYRIPDAILPPNAAMVYGFYDVQGYDSLYTGVYKDLSSKVQNMDSSPPENGNMVLVRRLLPDRLDLLAAYVLSSNPKWPGLGQLRLDSFSHGVGVYELPDAIPLAGTYAFRESAQSGLDRPVAPAHFELVTPNRIRVFPEPGERGDVIVTFLNYPGWKARVGGVSTDVELDSLFLCAREGGGQVVRFSFEPFSFRFGLFLMLVGVSALSCVGIFRWQRHKYRRSR